MGTKATTKRVLAEAPSDEDLKKVIDQFSRQRILDISKGALDKSVRKEQFDAIKKELVAKLTEEQGEEYMKEKAPLLDMYYEKLKKDVIRNFVIDTGMRIDGRKTNEVRPIWIEVDYLPTTHGSAAIHKRRDTVIDKSYAWYKE